MGRVDRNQPSGLSAPPALPAEKTDSFVRSTPVVRFVDTMIRAAVDGGASDIHLENTDGELRVRYRVDGRLRRTRTAPRSQRNAIISRLKVMAEMDVSVRRRAQDGSFVLEHGGRRLAFRVSTLPAGQGEKAVVRILDSRAAPTGLDQLGMGPADLKNVREILHGGHGALLVSGPTGSGKSTTVYAALQELDRESSNVVTLEDPVEYELPGASQVQVDRKAGLGFADALRAILRQDPDIVMVGEIRDPETAEIAMSAASTGHLVLSTIHTTDAPGAVMRLLDMNVPPFLVAGGLSGIVSQRLVGRLCPACGGPGCDSCRHEGHKGRTGIFQVLVVDEAFREAISRGRSTTTLRRLAVKRGMGTLAQDARRALTAGLSGPLELRDLLGTAKGEEAVCRLCDAMLPPDAGGCPMCGRSTGGRCGCGREVERRWLYCPWCLSSLR